MPPIKVPSCGKFLWSRASFSNVFEGMVRSINSVHTLYVNRSTK